MTDMHALLFALRPRQWTKNLVIFVPLVFDVKLLQPEYLLPTLLAFGIFCMLASSVYLVNDLLDAATDRLHPLKKHRAIASGRLQPRTALLTAMLLPVRSAP